jgi:formate--tetrahydrofolate ligase
MKNLPIEKIAAKIKIAKDYLIPYGRYMAKVDPAILQKLKKRKIGKYILVTAMTPTPLGEGKTVTTIGLAMSLNRLGKAASCSIRQPSLGPVFGIKGGAAGGGRAQVFPAEKLNLHFTGDAHAVGVAHNLAAAFLDNSLFHGNPLGIDPEKICWRRVLDISDRSLRRIRIGLGGNGVERESGFDITASSELMAVLALASSRKDLRKRVGKIILARTKSGSAITCEDLKIAGSIAALLRDAFEPNLIQTSEGTPCFVHAGPFGNIAQGNSSVIADKIALSCSDYVVTEAGFGADLGAEKFFDLKCRVSGLKPDAAVMVCSLRALKAHSRNHPEGGLENLTKQIENVRLFGVPVIVAINKFPGDSAREINLVRQKALRSGASGCYVSEFFRRGSAGGLELARAIIKISQRKKNFKFLYPLDMPIKEKISAIAKKIYGARGVEYSALAEEKIRLYAERGYNSLPVCMAKTQLSLAHDPGLKGRPRDFALPIKDISASLGAGFLCVACGNVQTMPGLPARPRGERIDIDAKGKIKGLS